MRWLLAATLLLGLSSRPALAVCDLSQVVGYTLFSGKTIEAYIQDGKRVSGFQGCVPTGCWFSPTTPGFVARKPSSTPLPCPRPTFSLGVRPT